MSQDISHVLQGWDFDPHELNVRVITSKDGSEKIQMRIDLGMLQMCRDGRPDGQRPFECESLLEFYEQQAAEYGKGYHLTTEAIAELFREAWQYNQRYLCCFHLGKYSLVVRDTDRNLRLFYFVRRYSKRKRDQWRFDQYRPYVLMMNTRARVMIALQAGEPRTAVLAEIEKGKRKIEEFLREHNKPVDPSQCYELESLNELAASTESPDSPEADGPESSEVSRLRTHLQRAIDGEDYEYAALLRDQIKRLEEREADGDD